jgi:hypothetical protein
MHRSKKERYSITSSAITRKPRRLFDHLVGGGEQRWRDGEADLPRLIV